jgi:hypothetical protein
MTSNPAANEGPGLSQFERVMDTFVAPSKTFADLLRSTSWWLPFVLMVVSTTALNVVIDKQIGFDRVYENQLAASPRQSERMNEMAPEQKAQALAIGTRITKYSAFAFPAILLLILALYSLIVWGCFNFGLGAQTTFSQVFAVSWYAALPYLFTPVVAIAVIYLGNNGDSYDLKNPVGTNIGYYLTSAPPLVRGLLSSIDVIKLWSVVLQAIGMAIVARKTLLQSALVIGILWFLGALLGAAGAAFS